MLKKIIISRTDGIGDVVLTLPAAGLLKKLYPNLQVCFIGRSYTQPVIRACKHIDEFVNWDEISALPQKGQLSFFKSLNADAIVHVFPNSQIAKLASEVGIPMRIGTSHRLYHWIYCTKLVSLGRKKSPLHESQLNLKLLCPLGAEPEYSLQEIAGLYGMDKIPPPGEPFKRLLDASKFNLILHPKSKGSAREWGLDNFGELIALLPKDKFKVFITGTTTDQQQLKPLLDKFGDEVIDLTGKMTLPEFMGFIGLADGLVAASTGPLHIAAALGKRAVGLYAPMRPIHPGRWSPVGKKASHLVLDKKCNKCKKSNHCECIRKISPQEVLFKLNN